MTQAPATTVANAVRQHGGGRHPLNLPCTVQAGRLQDTRGGVINRRAEGATSSKTLPASCAAAAHPTTGVRRARELSPSLRSQNCQHAQLVEGYTPLTPTENSHQRFQVSVQLVGHDPILYVTRATARNTVGQLCAFLQVKNHLEKRSRKLPIGQINNLDISSPGALSIKFLCNVAGVRHAREPVRPVDRLNKQLSKGLRAGSDLKERASGNIFSMPQQAFRLPLLTSAGIKGCPGRDNNRAEASKGLNPSSCVTGQHSKLEPVPNGAHQNPHRRASDEKSPYCPNGQFDHPWRCVFHAENPQRFVSSPSMKAHRHHVQRGAA